jgi:hypothetical protein
VCCIISRNVDSSVCELFGQMEAQEPVFRTRAHALPFATTAVAHELHKLEPHSLEYNFALLSFVAKALFFLVEIGGDMEQWASQCLFEPYIASESRSVRDHQ